MEKRGEMAVVYSIGYSGFTPEEFVQVLLENGVTALVDVRSSPYAAYHTEYDREVPARTLKESGILYRNYARECEAGEQEFFKPGIWTLKNSRSQSSSGRA